MLFPPPGVKIRRTLDTFWLPDTPTLIAEHDPKRVLLAVLLDGNNDIYVTFAGNREGLATPVPIVALYHDATYFWGPEEVWAECTFASGDSGGNIMVQSVFYD